MKRTVIISLFLIGKMGIFAQNTNNFLQFSLGTGYLMDAKIEATPLIMLEAGRSYHWLDMSISLDYANFYDTYSLASGTGSYNYPYLAGSLKAKVDFIKMFCQDTRHAFKIGGGIGLKYSGKYDFDSPFLEKRTDKTPITVAASLITSYEYMVVDKSWIGLFFKPSSIGSYVGVSFRRDL